MSQGPLTQWVNVPKHEIFTQDGDGATRDRCGKVTVEVFFEKASMPIGYKVRVRPTGGDNVEYTQKEVAATEASGNKQFHMRHKDYSNKVKEALNSSGERLGLMAGGTCSIASDGESDGKYDPPMGLPSRLNALPGNLRRLLTGSVWRSPIFTDKLTQRYAEERLTRTSAKGDVKQIL